MTKGPRAQSIPKLHHFVSQMHTDRFTDGRGRLHVFNKSSGKTYPGTPKSVFGETHLYTVEDAKGSKDTSFEIKLSALESRTNVIIEKIVAAARSGAVPGLAVEEKADWNLFFYMQWKRVPDVHRKVATLREGEDQLDKIFSMIRARFPERAAEIDDLNTPDERKRLLQGGIVKAIDSLGKDVLTLLDSRGLAIIRIIAPGESFVIGSLPIVRMGGDLRSRSAGAWLPIASDVAVGMGGLKGQEHLMFVDDPQTILAFNRVIADQSSSFAAASKSLIESLAAYVATRGENLDLVGADSQLPVRR
jgi:hypothetical protein